MDEVESQQRLIDAAVSAAFGSWRSHLRVQLEESNVLRRELEKKSDKLRQLQQRISSFDAVRQEYDHLKEELRALRSQYASATPPRRYEELEQQRDALLQDNQLKQKTIDSLRGMVNYERTKSKNWLRHSKSSPSPSFSEHRTNPRQPATTGSRIDNATTADGVSVLSNQALLQKLVMPLKIAEAQVKSPAPLAQACDGKLTSTVSVKNSDGESIHPPPPATDGTEHQDGPISFPDFDATYSYGDSSELPRTTGPYPQSSPGVQKPDISPLPHECSDKSPIEAFPSDSTAPPSPSCSMHEPNQEKLPQDQSLDSPEVVSARPVRRKPKILNISAGDAKLASGLAGNVVEPINLKSEPSESHQTAADNTSGLMSTTNESLGGKSFDSPKRGRGPQQSAAHSTRPISHIAEDDTVGLDSNPIDVQPAQSLSARKDDKSRPSSDSVHSRPLQEIKNDKQILPRTSNASGPPIKKRRSNDGRGAAAIPIIAEDGEDHNRRHKTTAAKSLRPASPARSNTSAYRRLGHLLEGPSPAKPVLANPSPRITNLMDGYLLNAAVSMKSMKKDQLDAMRLSKDKSWEWYESAEVLLDSVGSQRPPQPVKKAAQKSPEDNATVLKAQHEPQRPFSPAKCRLPDGPEDEEPFRSRPVHRLDLDHFKINPQPNAGVDYAYTDVIRNRDQRKCLPGCTRPECCGSKFRTLAGTLPKLTTNGKQFLGSDPSDEASSQQADTDILSSFLGPGSAEKIRTLTPLARENLLLEAKTKIAADKYGKMHRHAYERPKSPPGSRSARREEKGKGRG
jgi:hypothetical protein